MKLVLTRGNVLDAMDGLADIFINTWRQHDKSNLKLKLAGLLEDLELPHSPINCTFTGTTTEFIAESSSPYSLVGIRGSSSVKLEHFKQDVSKQDMERYLTILSAFIEGIITRHVVSVDELGDRKEVPRHRIKKLLEHGIEIEKPCELIMDPTYGVVLVVRGDPTRVDVESLELDDIGWTFPDGTQSFIQRWERGTVDNREE